MYDVFVSHAHEDKEQIVRPLAESLKKIGINVWYDEFSLKLGDSLRESIDHGLANSKFGIVVLSPHFFQKKWPQNELNGLFAKESVGEKSIIPLWHNIDYEEIVKISPLIADRVAAKTSEGLDLITLKILEVIEPNKDHAVNEGLAVTLSPPSIKLFSGGWAVKNQVIIHNRNDIHLYNVALKILPSANIATTSINLKFENQDGLMVGELGDINVSPEIIKAHVTDSKNNSALAVYFHTIKAHETKTIIISGTTETESTADLTIWSFETDSPTLLEQNGKVAVPIKFPENIKLHSLEIFMKKQK